MNIKIKEPSIGEVLITSYNDIEKETQFLLKALSALLILVMNSQEDKSKSKEFYSMLKELIEKADILFDDKRNEVEINATESFD